jgi:hypothetical protein
MAALTETLVIVAAVVSAWLFPRQIRSLPKLFSGLVAARRGLAIAAAALVGLCSSVAVGLWQGIPIPGTHDEFSYLLAADTYSRGRLTNPPDACWEHFENMHILQQPSYMSKYPPGQGLVLAFGQVICGLPIAGVWLSVGLAAAAVCWMLQGYVPNGWACLGGICLGLHVSIDYWAQSYWGGAVAVIGGALLFGAVARLIIRGDWRSGVALGTGLAILSMTRPYEGLVATFVAAAIWLFAAWRRSKSGTAKGAAESVGRQSSRRVGCAHQDGKNWWAQPTLQFAMAVTAVVVPTGLWQVYNNSVVTGRCWNLPYQVHDAMYVACPTFLWQSEIAAPPYRHNDMEQYYVGWERDRFLRKRAVFGFNGSAVTKAWIFLRFFVGLLLAVPVGLAAWRHAAGGVRHALFALCIAILATTQTLYLHPHYLAPFAGFVYLLAVQGWRTLRGCGPLGPALAPALCLAAVLAPPVVAVLHPYHRGTRRNDMQASLMNRPGRHLVLVEPGDDYDCHECWAYNGADLAGARVVWARSLDPVADACLVAHFPDRSVWRLHVDRGRCELKEEEVASKMSAARR